jgi:hypothetical protein
MNFEFPGLESKRVAIVDDNKDERDLKSIQLRGVGLDPYPIPGSFHHVDELLKVVTSVAELIVCDHYLQPGNYASFYGANAVACLYDLKHPAVLITQYLDQDCDFSIRPLRRKIPVVLRKEDATPEQILHGLSVAWNEHQGIVIPERQACRTLIRVSRIQTVSNQLFVDVDIPTWHDYHPIRFPASLLPLELRENLVVDQLLVARVNTGAAAAEDLYLDEFV